MKGLITIVILLASYNSYSMQQGNFEQRQRPQNDYGQSQGGNQDCEKQRRRRPPPPRRGHSGGDQMDNRQSNDWRPEQRNFEG